MRSINEEQVRYEVWGMALDGSQARQTDPSPGVVGFLHKDAAERMAKEYNVGVAENARMEQRPVARKFVVVESTTVRRVLP